MDGRGCPSAQIGCMHAKLFRNWPGRVQGHPPTQVLQVCGNVCRALRLPIWPQPFLVVCAATCDRPLTSVRFRQHSCPRSLDAIAARG